MQSNVNPINDEKPYIIQYVNPNTWQPYESEALRGLEPKMQQYARDLLTEFHNRHIGISPTMAAGLAKVLLISDTLSAAASPWKEIWSRLIDELPSSEKESKTIRSVSPKPSPNRGILLSSAPAYVIRRIAIPLVHKACWRLRKCILFSDDQLLTDSATIADLELYDQNLLNLMIYLANASRIDQDLQLFWKERSATLSHYSKPATSEYSLPDPDPLATGFLFRLESLPASSKEYQHLNRIHIRRPKHHTRQMREDCLAGIIQTRSLDDLQRILIGELLNPDALLADRLLNTGYLVTERKPKREKLRDAILIGLLPPDLHGRPARDFLRACWVNSMAVMYQILVQNHLPNSMIIWVEGPDLDRFHVSALSVAEIRLSQVQNIRSGFLDLTGWLPGLIDARKVHEHIPLDRENHDPMVDLVSQAGLNRTAKVPIEMENHAAIDWVSRVWRSEFHQKRRLSDPVNRGRPEKEIETVERLDRLIDQFAFANVMTFLPASRGPDGNPIDMSKTELYRLLFSVLRADEHAGYSISVNSYHSPSFLDPKAGEPYNSFYSPSQHQAQRWGEIPAPGDFHAASAELEQVWLEEWIREMQSGC